MKHLVNIFSFLVFLPFFSSPMFCAHETESKEMIEEDSIAQNVYNVLQDLNITNIKKEDLATIFSKLSSQDLNELRDLASEDNNFKLAALIRSYKSRPDIFASKP